MKKRFLIVSFVLAIGLLITFAGTAQAGNLIFNSDFSSGVSWPWRTSETWPGDIVGNVVSGEFCATINHKGVNVWDVLVRQRRLHIQAGHSYTGTFTAYAVERPTRVTAKVTQGHRPFWPDQVSQNFNLTTAPQVFTFSFTGRTITDQSVSFEDRGAEFVFQMGGSNFNGTGDGSDPLTVCFDNISLEDAAYTPPAVTPVVLPNVRLNQVGYMLYGLKQASVVNASTSALSWNLLDSGGNVVANGQTTVFGNDAASGDHLHIVDFTQYQTAGTGYTLVVGADTSHPFDISDTVYGQLKLDALSYFYQNRSGIAITAPYVSQVKWERPAGHLTEDQAVPCYTGPDRNNDQWTNCAPDGQPATFSTGYTRNVTGGWYDAGDHGKYVVNGGISVWTMMNQYERNLHQGDAAFAFGDGTMNIPENANGVPDILDEARWEMEFLLKMQVPDGETLAGMAHHKMHDDGWTDVPMLPSEDTQDRVLYPPSTAATLNLAATAAQCARIWQTIDPAFSAQCLTAAEKAWNAAQAHPSMLAQDLFLGGGPYDDTNVDDEFYWAAAELYITTGNATYQSALSASSHYLAVPTTLGTDGSAPMSWRDTAALGTISLAIVPNSLGSSAVAQARANIVAAADAFVANQQAQGYRTPYAAGSTGYAWGSNSFVLNELIVMALAYDFDGDIVYLDGVHGGLDYLLGRNALDKSYVSGYGENPLLNPHHRHWGWQAYPRPHDERYPAPPAGAISGGPNSGVALEDDNTTRAMGLRAACQATPQKCYVDDIDAFPVNEITINWNAPLAWVTAYVDENRPTLPVCDVQYRTRNEQGGMFSTDVTIVNKSATAIEGWTLTWTFPGNQQITQVWNAGHSQSGSAVTTWNTQPWNRVINPNGGTAVFGFNANFSGENKIPTNFKLNGMPCGRGRGGGDIPPSSLPVRLIPNGDWGGSYCMIVEVTNNTSAPVVWTVNFDVLGNIYSHWNFNYTRSGNTLTASGVQWNATLAPGQKTRDVGFCANR